MQGFLALRKTVTTKWKNSIIFQMCFILPITWKFAQNLPSLLFPVYKHYAINIADPNSMQDTCHMNFVIWPRSLPSHYGSVVEHWSAESEGLRFDSSLGLTIFSLSHTHDITEKKSFSTCKHVTCFCTTISCGWMNGKAFTILSPRSFV